MSPAALAPLLFLSLGANPYLEQAKGLYDEQYFEQCLQRLAEVDRWKETTPDELAQIELYQALCSFSLGQEQRAKAEDHLSLGLRMNPQLSLPPFSSPKLQAFFDEVKAKSAAQPVVSDAPVADAGVVSAPAIALTPEPSVVRRSPLTYAFGGGAVVAAGSGVVFASMAQSSSAASFDSEYEQVRFQRGEDARAHATRANVAFALAGALAVATVVALLVE